jgi:hypothetical protein
MQFGMLKLIFITILLGMVLLISSCRETGSIGNTSRSPSYMIAAQVTAVSSYPAKASLSRSGDIWMNTISSISLKVIMKPSGF